MNKVLFLLITVISVFFSTIGNAQEKSSQSINEVLYFLDSEDSLTIEDIDNVEFEKEELKNLNLGFYKGTVWIKLDLKEIENEANSIIEIENPNLDVVNIYTYSNGIRSNYGTFGDKVRKNQKNRCISIPDLNKETVVIQITNFGDQLYIPINILSKEDYKNKQRVEYLTFGVYFGIVFFVFILNLFLFLVIKEKSNLYYLLYLGGVILLNLGLTGLGYQFIWSDNSYVSNHVMPFAATFSIFFLVKFTRSFLETKTIVPKFDYVLKILEILLIINLINSLIPISFSYRTSILAINAIAFVLNILILPISIMSWRNNKYIAQIFVLAFSVLIVSVFIFILRNFGILGNSFYVKNSLYIGSSIEIILLSFAIVQKFKSFKNDAIGRLEELNLLKNEQNERLTSEVNRVTNEIKERNKEIEEKSKEIVDSINYAQRIQSGLVPNQEYFNSFFKDAFVIYRPKDILSGDFYWISETVTTENDKDNQNILVFALGDCTGHGVPGAMISVLGIRILNSSLKNKDVNSPGEALDFLNQEVSTTFNKNINEHSIADGMDIGMCAYFKESSTLYFAGANNNLWILRDQEILVYKGDRFAIGGFDGNDKFNSTAIEIIEGDRIFLMSDGFVDQFGGPNNKKYKSKRLKTFLIGNSNLDMSELKTKLNEEFDHWLGKEEQIDDVTIIGIQL